MSSVEKTIFLVITKIKQKILDYLQDEENWLVWEDGYKLRRLKMVKKNIKKFWESKTIRVGVLTVIGGVATMLADQIAAGGVITGLGVIQIILRVLTKEAII